MLDLKRVASVFFAGNEREARRYLCLVEIGVFGLPFVKEIHHDFRKRNGCAGFKVRSRGEIAQPRDISAAQWVIAINSETQRFLTIWNRRMHCRV